MSELKKMIMKLMKTNEKLKSRFNYDENLANIDVDWEFECKEVQKEKEKLEKELTNLVERERKSNTEKESMEIWEFVSSTHQNLMM